MIPENKKVEFLIINAAECEPYITIDHRMMLERAEECLVGVNALLIASGAPKALIGIENNKPEAIATMSKVVVITSLPRIFLRRILRRMRHSQRMRLFHIRREKCQSHYPLLI